MIDPIYAVIDTNVVVSAMLTHNPESPTRCLLGKVKDGQIIPMINESILDEYIEVLARPKFCLNKSRVLEVRELFLCRGLKCEPVTLCLDFIDPDDQVFYETYRQREDAYLVTGNLRHYPSEPRIILPADMLRVINILEVLPGGVLSDPPCEYLSEEKKNRIQRAWEAIEQCIRDAVANSMSDMSMEEIDEEIRLYRQSKK